MTTEIERRFLLDGAPALEGGERLRQGYLADEGDVSIRVRVTERAATLTVKAGSGLSRTEVEVAISLEQAEVLWPHTEGRRIVKIRHRVPLDSSGRSIAEVDEYDEALAGLWIVEVEFDSEDAATSFVPPQWFGREVTGERAWTNAALARSGRPPDRPAA